MFSKQTEEHLKVFVLHRLVGSLEDEFYWSEQSADSIWHSYWLLFVSNKINQHHILNFIFHKCVFQIFDSTVCKMKYLH